MLIGYYMLAVITVVIMITVNITIIPTQLTNNCANQNANVLSHKEKYNCHRSWKHQCLLPV